METTKMPPAQGAKPRPVVPLHDGFEHARPPAARPQAPEGHPPDAHGPDAIDMNVPTPRPIWLILAAVGFVALVAALLLVGLIPRQRIGKQLDLQADAALNAPIPVNVIKARRADTNSEISMPANLRPWQEVSIYARTTGYLKHFYVDISNQVKAGQLMAEIETPEVDQQLLQAKAALQQTRAAENKANSDLALARVTFNRYQTLAGTNSVTAQDLDQKRSDMQVDEANLESAKANVAAAEANVNRLTQLQQFEKVTAPFAGVVSGRGYDVGSLILADPTNVDVKPMFKIAENDVLRVFVNVPQSAALQVRKGMEVKVTTRETGARVFTGAVMGTTNYIDQTNRSLLTEVKVQNVQNPDGEFALLPGMYVQVSFVVKRDVPPLIIPAPALVTNAQGTQVATVNDGKVHFVKVQLGEDFGKEIEVIGGLEGAEPIIANPGERIVEGALVQPQTQGE